MPALSDWQNAVFLANRLGDWAQALAAAGGIYLVCYLLKVLLVRRLAALAARTDTDVDDLVVALLRRTRLRLLAVPALYLGLYRLDLPARPEHLLQILATLAVFLQAGLWGSTVVDFLIERYRRRPAVVGATNGEEDGGAGAATTLAALGLGGRVLLWSLVLLLALDNVGVDVTSLLTGLGVGGVAIALATQNILGDLFSSLSIVVDKPFVVGDAIAVDDLAGTVEHIGLKTTRLRGAGGEQLIFGNADLLKSRIRNFRRMDERRILQVFTVPFQTAPERVAALPGWLREIVDGVAGVRFERLHCRAFTAAGLEHELVYWVESADFAAAVAAQQAVNMAFLARLAAEGVGFAAAPPPAPPVAR
jgi:small-conductance mechanosensitive channel